ncbi:hypothetical protein BT96DRAFT_991996 [Gymnopus androsaceus JB14]|uniref:Uncharacterized protein n=1 Tax=Gymnopus androsaceus JB14 TaxID=1447944 RepID=A0A6A4HTZ3_9AGAR|nr:hypothetical protein BT96DRAFT_991996 [Gymnopus androsaceus JB14]
MSASYVTTQPFLKETSASLPATLKSATPPPMIPKSVTSPPTTAKAPTSFPSTPKSATSPFATPMAPFLSETLRITANPTLPLDIMQGLPEPSTAPATAEQILTIPSPLVVTPVDKDQYRKDSSHPAIASSE